MPRKPVPGQHRKISAEEITAIKAANTVVSSLKSRGDEYLQKLKQDQVFGYNQNLKFDRDFVDVINFSAKSKLHCNYSYLDCVVNFAYPLFKNQYAIYRENNHALGYVSWAWFNSESEHDFCNKQKIITDPNIVCSGSIGWIIDVIAPNGHLQQTMRHSIAVAKSMGINTTRFKFQRNYTNKKSRKNQWLYR